MAEVLGKLATFAFTVVAARVLTTQDFGAFAYALAFGLLVATLPSWGFDPLLVQRGSAEPRKLPVFFAEALAWRTAIAVPVLVAAGIAGFATRPNTRSGIALILVLAASVIDEYSRGGQGAAAARQQQVGVGVALVVQRMVTAALAIAALAGGLGLVGLSAAYLAGTVIGLVGVLIAVRRLGISPDFRSISRAGLMITGRRSIAVGFSVVASMALFRIDQVILEALRGQEAVATYAAAYRLLETVLFLTWAVERSIFPVMSAGAAESWRLLRGVEKGVAALALVYVPFGVGLWLEAEPILRILYGQPYAAEGVWVARWLAASPLLFAVQYLAVGALMARERRWQVFWGTAVALALNVGMNFALIPVLGGAGAAIATTASYAVSCIGLLAFLIPHIGVVRIDRALAVPAAASAIMAVVILTVDQGLLVDVVLGVAVYAGAWVALASWGAPDQIAVMRSVLPWRR